MFAVTAADAKFLPIIDLWEERVVACGMTPVIYDLGGLDRGTKFTPPVQGFDLFREKGYYSILADGTYKSRAVHKPFVCEQAAKELQAPFLYLDADAFLRGEPTKIYGDWVAAVTVRPQREWNRTTDAKRSYLGKINAGVIWFNDMPDTLDFISLWKRMTIEEMNDQRALNLILAEITRTEELADLGIMPFPTEIYNNYYLNESIDVLEKAVIVHLKNSEWQGKTRQQLLERCKLAMDREWESADTVYSSFVDDSDFDLLGIVEGLDAFIEDVMAPGPDEEIIVPDGGDGSGDNPGLIEDPTPAEAFTPADPQGS